MINRAEIDRRLDFVGRSRGDVLKALNDRGVRCDKSALSRALAGEIMDSFSGIRAAADEITAAWVKKRITELEKLVADELAPYGVAGKVTVGVPDKREVPVYVDGELFGLYNEATHRMQ